MNMPFSNAFRAVARAAFCAAVLGLAVTGPAQAQLNPLGATPTLNATDLNAVAFDEASGVYLHVGSTGRLRGRFMDAQGATLGGQFDISSGLPGSTYASWASAAYSSGSNARVFLVAYASEINANQCKNVFGQLVRYNGIGGELVGGAFPLSSVPVLGSCRNNPSAVAQEVGGVAFNPATNQFLVVWSDGRGGWDVYGRLVNVDGTLAGGEMNLTGHPAYQSQPTVAHDWQTNTFLVAYIADVSATAVGTMARVLNGAAQPITGPITLSAGGYQDLPSAMFLPEPGRFLVVWRETPGGTVTDVMGRLVGPDGSLASATYPVIATSVFDGLPDGRYNWVSRNTLVVAQHDSGFIVGALLDAFGTPQARWTPLSTVAPAPRGGSFRPHVAVGPAGQFGVGYVLNLVTGYVDRFQAPPASTPGPVYGGTPPQPPLPNPTDPTSIDFAGAVNGSEYFAEGYASNDGLAFNTYYQLQNATDTPATVRAYFARQTSDGSVVLKERQVEVRANSRKTYDLKAEVGLGPWSAVFQSLTPGVPVATQQSVFWGADFEGSSTATGARHAATQWLFAEGTRVNNDFFRNYFLLFNPGTAPIQVKGEFFGPGATAPVEHVYTLPPASRFTIDGNEQVPGLANQDFSARFTSLDQASPFVAQRAMYWGQNYVGGHSSMGTTAARPTWMFAEGVTAPAFDTFFTLLNPNPFPVDVSVTYLREVGGPFTPSEPFQLPANSRRTIYANVELGNIGGFGATFTTIGGHGIVVERSIYWGPGGFDWIEGTNDMGVNAPAMTWALPEGSDAGLFDTYVLVANPNAFPVNVLVQFFLENGGRITVPPFVVAAGKRLTVDMNVPRFALPPMSEEDAALLKGKSFSVKVTSLTQNGPILVEGAVYRNWQDSTRWRAGASSFGVPQ